MAPCWSNTAKLSPCLSTRVCSSARGSVARIEKGACVSSVCIAAILREQPSIDRDVVARHALRGEALLEHPAHLPPRDLGQPAHRRDRIVNGVTHETGPSVHHD